MTKEEFEAPYIKVDEYRYSCETCGFPISIFFYKSGASAIQPHWYCDRPTIKIMTLNPQRLGVVTA